MKRFHKFKIYGIGKIGPKGQVVIPADARRELSLDPGERVVVMNMPHGGALMVMNEEIFNEHLERMRGRFGPLGSLGDEYKKYQREADFDD